MARRRCGWIAAAFALGAMPAAIAADDVRPFPYPFEHHVSFASDVDMQSPAHGAEIHRLLNESLGLPISDSIWAQTSGAQAGGSGFVTAGLELNRAKTGRDGRAAYIELLRAWHRGYADHFHSWHGDEVPQLRDAFPAPAIFGAKPASIRLVPPPESLRPISYFRLRIVFDKDPPRDTVVIGRDNAGRSFRANLENAGVERYKGEDKERIVELFFGRNPAFSIEAGFKLVDLSELTFAAAACGEGCAGAVRRVERDNFSRAAVKDTLEVFDHFAIRPPLYTSHGGFTLVQNFTRGGQSLEMPASPGSVFAAPNVLRRMTGLADVKESQGYTVDLLRKLGVEHVWYYNTIDRDNHMWNAPPAPLSRAVDGMYAVSRTRGPIYRTDDVRSFTEDLRRVEPLLEPVDLKSIHCADTCTSDQGSTVGLLVALALVRVDAGLPTDNLWYTHFGSKGADWTATPGKPLRESAERWFVRLAERYYGFDRTLGAERRVWTAPAATVVRYRAMMSMVRDNVAVEGDVVRIKSWIDPVLGRRVPDAAAGLRDLNGLTIYVGDPARAAVFLDDVPIASFTRNPPDRTGRASVTIVAENAPTAMLGRVPLEERGKLSRNGSTTFQAAGRPISLTATRPGDAAASATFDGLSLWNTTHLSFAFGKARDDGKPVEGRAFFEMTMADGGRIVAAEAAAGAATPPLDAGAGWILRPAPSGMPVKHVLAMTSASWGRPGPAGRPPLPIGRVVAVRFGLLGAQPGDTLKDVTLAALRPDPTAHDETTRVGGIVSLANVPLPGIAVRVGFANGETITTATDAEGFFIARGMRRGDIVEVSTMAGRCPPSQGRRVEVFAPAMELDIDLANCR